MQETEPSFSEVLLQQEWSGGCWWKWSSFVNMALRFSSSVPLFLLCHWDGVTVGRGRWHVDRERAAPTNPHPPTRQHPPGCHLLLLSVWPSCQPHTRWRPHDLKLWGERSRFYTCFLFWAPPTPLCLLFSQCVVLIEKRVESLIPLIKKIMNRHCFRIYCLKEIMHMVKGQNPNFESYLPLNMSSGCCHLCCTFHTCYMLL